MNLLQSILLIAWGFLSYGLGAIPVGLIIGKIHGIDLRKHGSGNIGAANVARTLGTKWGSLVFLLDFLKGFLPTWITHILITKFVPPNILSGEQASAAILLFFLLPLIGHLFPIFLKFRGGKGVATAAGLLAMLVPMVFFVTLVSFMIVFLLSRTISLASLTAALIMPSAFALGITLFPKIIQNSSLPIVTHAPLAFLLALLLVSLLIIIQHRSNIRRLLLAREDTFKKK